VIGAKQILQIKNEAGLRKLAVAQASKISADVVESTLPLAARIEHGRWVADCQCGGGVACDPTMPIAVCFVHQDPDDPTGAVETRVHTAIVWPVNRGRIEALLEARGLNRNRNWRPGETEADLTRENAANGVGK